MSIRKLLAYAAIYFFWGASFLAIREIVAVSPPFVAAGFRFTCAGLILCAYSLWQRTAKPTRRQWINAAILGTIIFAGDYGALFWAEKEVPSGLAAVIAATIPVWVLLTELAVSRSGTPNMNALAGIVLGITGVVLLTIPAGLHNSRFSLSALVLLFGCFVWAGGTVASRHLDLPKQISMSAGLQMTFGGCLLFLVSSVDGEIAQLPIVLQHWTWRLTFAMAYLILFASILAFSAYVWLIARDPATRVSSYAYVNPVVALLLGLLIAHEHASPLQYVGAALVLAGVASTIAGKRPLVPRPLQKLS